MTNLSAADLIESYNQTRDKWVRRDCLPVCFDKPLFVGKPDTKVHQDFKDAVKATAKILTSKSSILHGAVLCALRCLDVEVKAELTFCVGEAEDRLQVGLVGLVDDDIRVIFLSAHYLYGIPFRASDETRTWNAERDGTELQLNELMAMVTASQRVLANAASKPKEILVIIPNSNSEKIFWTAFTPAKDMLLTEANFRTPMKTLHLREMNNRVFTSNAEEIYKLIHSFLAEPTQEPRS